MIGFGISLVALTAACFLISLVYALTSGQRPGRVWRETLSGFGILFGGVLLLALLIEVLALIYS